MNKHQLFLSFDSIIYTIKFRWNSYGNEVNVHYVSNSFHCHVSEQMSPIEKQDKEGRFWNLFNGGKIQYCRTKLYFIAIKT